MSDYAAFLRSKTRLWTGAGIDIADGPIRGLHPFQSALSRWALRKGRAALWADTGLGKTRMQLAWAARIPGRVLILAPLCVGPQTIREGSTIGVHVGDLGSGAPIEITNYERLHQIVSRNYAGIVLDESSILKSFDGKTRTRLIAAFRDTPYKLCCTATPAPNDIAELANHCEFLGIMTRAEMLATFFVHDDQGWRLRGYAREPFYRWLASWGLFLRRPSDLGFSDDGYILPPLSIDDIVVPDEGPAGEYLFSEMGLGGIRGRLVARRSSLSRRVDAALRLVRATPGPWLVWCGLNDEQSAMAAGLGEDCVSVEGADDPTVKVARIEAFLAGRVRVLITKPKIAGFGLNLQHCAQMVFLGLGDSYETYYQAIRRCWRAGQTQPVRAYVVVSAAEMGIVANVRRKEEEAATVSQGLIDAMREAEKEEIGMTTQQREIVSRAEATGSAWRLIHGDSVEELPRLPEASIDLSVYSPPFASLYTYTASERDIGNSSTREEFLAHLGYIIRELYRVTKPGRLTACHVAQITTTLVSHGVIGLVDLRGAMIRAFTEADWIYHGEVCIDKDPQAQAIRTHSKALLFVQLKKDSSWLRPALADYVLVFRKPGENAVSIHPDLSNEDWIEWARPIWYNIRESDTLNVRAGRADADDRHICPLQLGTIERCVRLWSNPGETVLTPFAGIGSEVYEAVRLGRRAIGIELKRSYWETAVETLRRLEHDRMAQPSLFA